MNELFDSITNLPHGHLCITVTALFRRTALLSSQWDSASVVILKLSELHRQENVLKPGLLCDS